MKRSLSGWILSGILSTATLAFSQIATTSIHGTIKDPSGAVVAGARVTLLDKATGKMFSADSGNTGFYDLEQIPPATYTITVAASGFGDQTKVAELLVNQPATVDFTLTVQSSTVTVDVSAEAQTLNTTDASLGNSADNALIQALPSETRNVPDLLSLQPGVLYLPPTMTDSRSGSVNGGRSDQGNVTMDGIDDNDQVNGFAFNGVLRETQDSIEEFRVTTGDANADQGRSSGAQINMVTKAGTNKFHGAAYEYYRPPLTASNNWFNKQAELGEGLPNVPSKVLRNIYGVAVGGPIRKDKLFFFGNYEAERLAENAQVNETVASPTYAQGILQFPDAAGNTQAISAKQLAALDSGCSVCNTSEYPHPAGANGAALGYFNSMPLQNGTLLGDGGFNSGSFSFSSPNPIHQNTAIGKIDFTPNDRHRIFVRGNLQDDYQGYPENFPGQGPEQVLQDDSKGVIAGETWTITPNLINDIRYGYIRQGYSYRGPGVGDFVDFRFMATTTSEFRTAITQVPVNNIVDNLSWTRGKHSFGFGANWRLIHQDHDQDTTTWQFGSSNPYWLSGPPPTPAAVPDGFDNAWEIAYDNLVGTIPSLTNSYNYKITSASSASLLPDGAFLSRAFSANEFEWYAQDAWHVRPNLIVTFGIRHSLLETPWETNGQQVSPTVDTHAWYLQREAAAQGGQIYEPNLLFSPSGNFYGRPGFYRMNPDNFAPRLAIAYSPDSKTSIRAGAGIYYDHFGEALIDTYDQEGSFGISSSVTNPAGVYSVQDSPRFLGRNILPDINNGGSPQVEHYPFAAPQGNFAITWGIDNKLKTPYSETFDLSVQRQLPGGFTLESAYVGRLGRHLIQQNDLAEPVDFVDPDGGGDYFAAASQLSRLVDANGGNDCASVPRIAFFEHVFSYMAGFNPATLPGGAPNPCPTPNASATQAVYRYEWAPFRSGAGETTSLADLDFFCFNGAFLVPYNCTGPSRFWQNQFSSLYALDTIGMSYYNAGQFTLRHPTSHGLETDLSYTYSHSIDMGSDTERSNEFGTNASNTGSFSEILNTWKPYLNRASSDFDTRHLVTVDAVYLLPFGRGKTLLSGANSVLDAFVGGWQLSGISRWSSGLPWGVIAPGWATNWQIESYGVDTQPVKIRRHFQAGDPEFFDNPTTINNGITTGGPIRLPYPGEAGERNNFRGDGYFDLDNGLAKTWKIRESGSVKFAWEVYNVTNTVRFDPASIGSQLSGGNLGIATALLTVPRRMQFSLRYDF